MKRLIVFLMLLALPIRTVLAVSGFGCTAMPMQMPMPQAGFDGAPCPMHTVDGMQMATDVETPVQSAPSSCFACAAACCAALAPVPAAIVGTFSSDDQALGVVETSFANAVRHTLERPPRAV